MNPLKRMNKNPRFFDWIVVVACLLSCLSAQAKVKSPLVNGDFEGGVPVGWSPIAYSQVNPPVVETNNPGWGSYALALERVPNVSGNPPGVSQSIAVGGGSQALTIDFDYENAGGSVVLFRIRAGDRYYDAVSGRWESAEIVAREKFFQRNWGKDASNKTSYDNFKARTVLLENDGINSYSVTIPLLDGVDSYVLEFYNTVAGSTAHLDNVQINAPPR